MKLSGKKLTTAILAGLMGATMFGSSVFADTTLDAVQTLASQNSDKITDLTSRVSKLETASSDATQNTKDIAANKTAIDKNAADIAINKTSIANVSGQVDALQKDSATVKDAATLINKNADAINNIGQYENRLSKAEKDLKTVTQISNNNAAAIGSDTNGTAVKEGKFVHALSQNTEDPLKSVTIGTNLNALDDAVDKANQQINTNKTDIATNKADIAQNKTDIATNKTDIATNKADIAQNKTDIATNKTDIATNKADIAQNKTDIATNKTDIATNKADIAQNKTDIATNKTDIATNKADIAQNKTDIATNKTDIATNKADIAQNKTDIATNKTDIATNKADIAQNKTDIATNKTDIATNKKAINDEAATRQAADQNLQNQINNNSTSINDLYGRYSSLKTDINKVGARSAALAGLHPLDFDPANKLNFAVASGSFKGENSVALGAFYRPNENIMFSAASTMGDSDNAYTFGLSFKIGPSSAKTKTTSPDAEELYKVVGELQDQLAAQQKEIEQLKADKAK